jgi:2-amino-4-hydroxy-6-hydroxymethyldihydropteridine diphosphokinase
VKKAYLSLGSNVGDRLGYLRAALQQLEAHPQVVVEAKSQIYETQSVEGGGETDFLNAALRVSTSLSAIELLKFTNSIEEKLGRPQPPRHGPRAIDIDILLYGDERMADEVLTLPHPRMAGRAFVLKPLLDVLEGGWVNATGLDW